MTNGVVPTFDPTWLWIAVVASAFATYIWRAFGVAAARHISADGAMSRWIACVAYAILAGLIARMIVIPIGVLDEAPMFDRLFALSLGFAVFFFFKRHLIFGLLTALFVFVGLTVYRAGDHWTDALAAPAPLLSMGTDAGDCTAPTPVCAWTNRLYAVSAFDPVGTATAIAPGVLVTSRHVVADESQATIFGSDRSPHSADVIPTDFAGDLIRLRVTGSFHPHPAVKPEPAVLGETVYAIGIDIGRNAVRVYEPGTIIALPPTGLTAAHIHHTAVSGPGNSGGILVNAEGTLIGFIAAGGDGRNEAVPATLLSDLNNQSGPEFADVSHRIGASMRTCVLGLEGLRGRRAPVDQVIPIAEACSASGNRQMMDNAAQALAFAGDRDAAVALFDASLALDPNAPNTLISQTITLHLLRRFADSLPLINSLIEMLPADQQVLRLAVHAAKFTPDPDLGDRALNLLGEHFPNQEPMARQFLESGT